MTTVGQRLFKLRYLTPATPRHFSVTVDKSEIEQHNKFAQVWWDKSNGPMKALHSFNDLRIPFIRNGLINVKQVKEEDCDKPNYLKGLKMLDVGCGGGILTMPLARLGADVTGLDPSTELIEVAKTYAKTNLKPETSVQFISSSIEEHCLTHREHYDVVVLSEVLEHVTMKEMFVHSCIDALKPGGSVFVTTINRTIIAWLTSILIAEYIINLLPKGNHEWSKLVTPEEARNYLSSAGCKELQTSGFMYIPYKNVWYWSTSKSVSYAVHAIKCQN